MKIDRNITRDAYLIIFNCTGFKTSSTIIKVIFPCPYEFFIKPESKDFPENANINTVSIYIYIYIYIYSNSMESIAKMGT
jgi:hypothetical protein